MIPRLLLLSLLSTLAHAAPEPRCAAAAKEQAAKLLTFHFGPDERISIEPTVKAVPPLKNPANAKQTFDVLEVWGSIYKGRYRMRLIYGPDCVLMGQEILEHASL